MSEGRRSWRDVSPEIREEAQKWLVRQQSANTPEVRDELARWLAESTDHRIAFERTKAIQAAAELVKDSETHGVDRPGDPADEPEEFGEVVELAPPAGRRLWPTTTRSRAGLIIGAAAAAAAVILFVDGPIRVSDADGLLCSPADASILTHHGDIRRFDLSDGSIVTLDSDSEMACALTDSARRARLVRGRARFAVKADPRPFSVTAGSGSIQTNSGTFDVALDKQGRASIHVLNGSTQVHSLEQHGSAPDLGRSIATGEHFTYHFGSYGEIATGETGKMDDSQWPSGWVEARSISLANLVEEANRYSALPIVIDGPELGRLEVSGRYRVADTEVFLSRLAELLDLRVDREPDAIHLRRKK